MLDHRPRPTKIPRTIAPARPAGPQFSITIDDSLRGPYAWSVVEKGQLLLRVRYLVPYDELAWAYAERLPSWAKRRIFSGLGVVDPTVSLNGYLTTRWWGPEDVATHDAATMVETVLGLIPWQHDWLVK